MSKSSVFMGLILLSINWFYDYGNDRHSENGLRGFVNSVNRYAKIDVKKKEIIIKDFEWGYGLYGFQKLSGDFEKLEKEIYRCLWKEEGRYKLLYQRSSINRYGEKEEYDLETVCLIDATTLNRYENFDRWVSDRGGLYSVFIKRFIEYDTYTGPTYIFPDDKYK